MLRFSNQVNNDIHHQGITLLSEVGCVLQPGLLKKVQGMGWYLEEANLAQVSTNILDFEVTPVHAVYEEICRDATVR